MPTVAVIGGIGCGKSAVTSRLAAHGAVVVDADVVAREVVERGSPVLARLVDEFGEGILASDGSLDRDALAGLAFVDADATSRLNAIVHPAIGAELVRQVSSARAEAVVVAVAIPLYRAEHRERLGIDLVVCVDCPAALARERLVAQRGMDADDVDRRMAAQPSAAERRALADEVLENGGSPRDLDEAVASLWRRLEAT